MPELTIDLIYNPIYSLAAPLYYTLENKGISDANNALGVVGGINVNFDVAIENQTLAHAGVINIDNYNTISNLNAVLDIGAYERLALTTHADFDLMSANHNVVNESLQNVIGDPTVVSCRAAARIGAKDFTKWAAKACAKSTKPTSAMIFCSLSTMLEDKYINKSTEAGLYMGCKYVVKTIKEGSKDLVDLYLEWSKDISNDINDIRLWLTFINSAEGMMWLYNQVGKQ